MAGMRALGRVYDVVNNYTGVDICLKDCSAIGLVAISGSTASTLTFVAKPSFGGAAKNVTPANGFGQPATLYTRTANTAAWVANAASWSTNALSLSATNGAINYVDFFVSELADTYDYLNVTVAGTGATTPVAILYDLVSQRIPANLRIPSA